MTNQTPAEGARILGATTLAEVVRVSHTPRQTLVDTFYRNRQKFDCLVLGSLALAKAERAEA